MCRETKVCKVSPSMLNHKPHGSVVDTTTVESIQQILNLNKGADVDDTFNRVPMGYMRQEMA